VPCGLGKEALCLTYACRTILKRALEVTPEAPEIEPDLLEYLAAAADGDARVALQSLELALFTAGKGLDKDVLKESLRKAHMQYDRTGDNHYDHIS
jgi:putative ATPase